MTELYFRRFEESPSFGTLGPILLPVLRVPYLHIGCVCSFFLIVYVTITLYSTVTHDQTWKCSFLIPLAWFSWGKKNHHPMSVSCVTDYILRDSFSKRHAILELIIGSVNSKLSLIHHFVSYSLTNYCNAAEFAKMAALPNSGASCVVLHIWFVHEPTGADAVRVLQSQ